MADKVVVTAGYQGPPGPKGADGKLSQEIIDNLIKEVKQEVSKDVFPTYVHTQSAPLDTWTIPHNLGRELVSVTVYDSTNTEVLGFDCTLIDNNTAQLSFRASFSGKAYIL